MTSPPPHKPDDAGLPDLVPGAPQAPQLGLLQKSGMLPDAILDVPSFDDMPGGPTHSAHPGADVIATPARPPVGRSPLGQAFLRLRKNRMAMVGLWLIGLLFALGFSAPLLARYVLHFSPDEQHTSFAFAEPGLRDVSLDHPAYDGEPASFATVDLNGDGRIACHVEPIAALTSDAKAAPALLQRALGRDRGVWPAESQVPLRQVMAAWAGTLRCPELDDLAAAERYFAFLIDHFDAATGQAAVKPGLREPDRMLSRAEYPKQPGDHPDARVAALAQRLGLLGDKGFARLDLDRDGLLTRAEITDAGRTSRFDKTHLLNHHDDDGDLAISQAEFPGLPALHRFWLGTDQKGRDMLVRLLYGARVSLLIGLLATLVSFVIGVSYGAIAGYFGGRVDSFLMRVVDVLYGLPFMFIVILLLVVAGRSTLNLFIALGAVSWLNMARIVRGQVLSIRRREYVEAAVAMGLSEGRILLRHVLPNTVGPVIVYATLSVPAVIVEEAFLSFLGLGVQPPDASWGSLIAEGARMMADRPWLILYPALALATALFSLNFIGDGLRDALDPRGSR